MQQEGGGQAARGPTRKVVLRVAVLLAAVAGATLYLLAPQPEPQHCWLVFGPEGKVRILVRVDGDALTLTHFLDGELTGRRERFPGCPQCKNVSLADPDGETSYLITKAGRTCTHKAGDPTQILFHVDIRGPLNYREYCDITAMPCRPESAPLAHFHGPLTIKYPWKITDDLALTRGHDPTELLAAAGTFDEDKGCWVIVRFEDQDGKGPPFPPGIRPFVDVEFPPKIAGDAPIVRRYPIPELGMGVLFRGPVPVPEEAGNGIAKLRLSFDSWKAARVALSTCELPIVDGK